MRRTIYLARHGQTAWNLAGRWQGHTDIPLDDVGRAQARALAEMLRGRGVGSVHASDLARARETAEIVAAVLGVGPVTVDADLRERCFGIFEGLTRQQCATQHAEVFARYRADPRQHPPGAESQQALLDRMLAAVRRTAEDPSGDDEAARLIVSHGGSIRVLLDHVMGWSTPPIENGTVFKVVVTATAIGEAEFLASRPA